MVFLYLYGNTVKMWKWNTITNLVVVFFTLFLIHNLSVINQLCTQRKDVK
jgi:hypothetical protein